MTLPTSALSSAGGTRHHPPARQPGTLERPELVELLDDLVERHPVTVVTAPSGFGKTTVVSAWAERAPYVVSWLALDPQEARSVDEAILAAIESVAPIERSRDHFGPATPTEPLDLRGRLEGVLAGVGDPVVLVVDDAQRAVASLDSGLLAGLVSRMPSMLRIVLVGTTALEVRMPRFVLTNPEAVIGAEALAFDAGEVAGLAVRMSSNADATAVHADTAGWPIAVRLALLSGSPPRGRTSRTRGLMHEYVRDVILSALDPELARFVVEAAVCDDVTPQLAAELTGQPDAGRLLERCRRLGLFLDRHDGPSGPEYTWHALFARHCRDLLAEEDPQRLEAMHRKAATLLAEARPLDAVAHHLALGEGDAAASLILATWVRLVVGNAAAGVDRACLSLPARLADRPALQLVRACARDVLGEHTSARELFEQAEAAATDDEETQRTLELARLFFVDERSRVGAAVAAVRARFGSHPVAASENAAIAFLLGWTELRERTNPELILESLQSAARKAEAVGDRALARRSRECLAYALVWAGRFGEARPLLEAFQQEPADESSWVAYIGGSSAVAVGMLAFFGNDLARAEQEFRRVIAFGGTRRTFSDLARVLLACAAAATGDARQCRRAALELQFLPLGEVQGIAWPRFRQAAVALLEEAVGHRDRAVTLARALAEESAMPIVAVLMAGVLRRAGAYTEALQVLRRQSAFAGVSYVRVAALATSALGQWSAGRTEAAHELCEEALAIAEAEVIRLPFADADPEMRDLLGAHVAWGTKHEEFVLSCLRPSVGSALSALSERERDVFEQLRTTLTTTEIADRLGVSVNTIKTHQRSIYRKLGVTSRREALRQYT